MEDDPKPGYSDFFLAGSDWQPFDFAAQKIRAKLGVSHGASHRMLREQCASGDVRAILVTYIGGHNRPIRRIKPIEWRVTELDIRDDDLHNEEGNWVEVSLDDLEYWLEQEEPEAEPMPKHKRDEAIARRLREGAVPGSDMPWKKWHDLIRKDIGAAATDVGCSDDRIEKVTRAMMRRPKGHIGQPNMTDVT